MAKAYGYCRVSTSNQVDKGNSLPHQQKQVRLICELEGYELGHIYTEEGVSASTPLKKRPQGQQLLDIVEEGDIIVTLKLDRLFRDIGDAVATLKALKKKGVILYIKALGGDVTSDGVSSLVFNLLSSVAEFERDQIAERVRTIKREQAAEGRYLGGTIPFGYQIAERAGKEYIERDPVIMKALTEVRGLGVSKRVQSNVLKYQHGIVVSENTLYKFEKRHPSPLTPPPTTPHPAHPTPHV